jgi:release factor glutamine methyltransferase
MEPTGNLVKNIVERFRHQLAGKYPDQEIIQFVYILFNEYLGWSKSKVHLSYSVDVSAETSSLMNLALKELLAGKPIQYILGKTIFHESLLQVNDQVLVPRPETEELCLMIAATHRGSEVRDFSILDIGTGSGCIAIDLKKHIQGSLVTAIDVSGAALEVARENARLNHAEISFCQSDILNDDNWQEIGRFHLIVSNPPYVLEREKSGMHVNVLEFEPALALFVADDDPLKFYRAISGFAKTHLICPGYLYFEINEKFGSEVRDLVLSLGFDDVKISKDFHGKDRFLSAILTAPSIPPL